MKLALSSDEQLTHINALVFGDSGIGKTTSLRTLPEKQTVIAVSERGVVPLRKYKYNVVQFTSWDEIRGLCRWFMAPDQIEDNDIQLTVKSCKVLVIDSLSEVSDLCMREIIEVDRRRVIKERTGDKRDTPKGMYEDQMQLEDWGVYRTRMSKLLSTLAHLPVHVIVTCRAAWSKDKQGGDHHCTPNLSGKLALECPAYFDLVLYMQAGVDADGKPMRQWRTYNDGTTLGKDASGVLDPLEETNWTNLFRKILDKGDDES